MTAASAVFSVVPGRDDEGSHVFSVIVKRSYRFDGNGAVERLEADHPLRLVDEYHDGGDPEWATVAHESEVAPYKAATDVVVVGSAYAPRGVAVQQMAVAVKVGAHQKVLTITGDRHCHFVAGGTPVFSEPAPFTVLPIRYEHAYGGRDERSIPEIPFLYPRNFMGKGVVLRNTREAVDGLALPNIEDPKDLLTPDRLLIHEPERWHYQPLPQGLGWRQREWYPRMGLLGTYPAFLAAGTVTPEERLGLLPPNHVALAKQSKLRPLLGRFANGASLGLTFPFLRGDEAIALGGMSLAGIQRFTLPADVPRITLDIGRGEQQADPRLHTVSIRPSDGEFDLIWRGSIAYEGYAWLPKMARLHAAVE